jgi:hypothetical protein
MQRRAQVREIGFPKAPRPSSGDQGVSCPPDAQQCRRCDLVRELCGPFWNTKHIHRLPWCANDGADDHYQEGRRRWRVGKENLRGPRSVAGSRRRRNFDGDRRNHGPEILSAIRKS